MSSAGGFGVWCKHDANVLMEGCVVEEVNRTGVACFNQGVVTINDSTVKGVGVHGVCLRGASVVRLSRVIIQSCKARWWCGASWGCVGGLL